MAGNQHWGHATSQDLYHWTNQPIALSPSKPDEYIFSGSAVIDSDNTSGFFPNQTDGVVAIYTVDAPDVETQHIAYSTDGGYTFTKYQNNPVINSTSKDFRDPQVTWHSETQRWVLAIAYAEDLVIGLYTSPNLRDWTHASNFSQPGLPGTQFECPNLVKFSVDDASGEENKHVLFISVNPGAPLGGSGTYYVVGDFNGTHFTSEDAHETLYDFAEDNYAAQWFSGLPDKSPVSIVWASNWEYTDKVPTGPLEGWRSSTGLPRVHSLINLDGKWTVTQAPFEDLSPVRGRRLAEERLGNDETTVDFADVDSNAISFNVSINGLVATDPAGQVYFNFTSSSSGEYLDGGVVLDTGRFWMNRAGTKGFTRADNADFTSLFNTSISSLESGSFSFSGVIDRSVFEVFLAHGNTGTMTFFPTAPLDSLTISAEGLDEQTKVSLDVWSLESGWDN